jgi:hypothetical protein
MGGGRAGHEAASLQVLRNRFGRVLRCLDGMLQGWVGVLALLVEGCCTQAGPGAAVAGSGAVASESPAPGVVGLATCAQPSSGAAGEHAAAEGATADTGGIDKTAADRAADDVWHVVQELLVSLLQAVDIFRQLDRSDCGSLHAAPIGDPESPADGVASGGRECAVESGGILSRQPPRANFTPEEGFEPSAGAGAGGCGRRVEGACAASLGRVEDACAASGGRAEGACFDGGEGMDDAWVPAARSVQRTLITLAVPALPRAARAGDWDGVKGSRRALHLCLTTLCKLWLCCVRDPEHLPEAVALLQRCWGLLNRDQVRATPLPVVVSTAVSTARGKPGKRQKQESVFAQLCASLALAWLRWPERTLDQPQMPHEIWRAPLPPATGLGGRAAPSVSCLDRIGFRIAEAAAGMGYIPDSRAEAEAAGGNAGGANCLQGEERERAEAMAAALGEAFRKSHADGVEVEDQAVPGAPGWSIRWRPRRGASGKGDASFTAPDGTKLWSVRAARRALRLEPPLGATASARAATGPTQGLGRGMRNQAARDAGAASMTLELHIVDVPARMGSTLDEPLGAAIRGLADACVEHLFGREATGDDAATAAGAPAQSKQPQRDHKGCLSLQTASPVEAELLLQHQLLQCPAGALDGEAVGSGVCKAQPERNRRKRLRDQLRRFLPVELAPGKGEGSWGSIALDSGAGLPGSSAGPAASTHPMAGVASAGSSSAGATGSQHPLASVLPLMPPPLRPSEAAAAHGTAASAAAALTGGWVLGAHLCAALASLEAAVGEAEYIAEVSKMQIRSALQPPRSP